MFSEPSPTLTAVLQVTHSSTTSLRDIGELVAEDKALTDIVLRFANFRQVGIGREVDDVHRAALLLSANSIRYIAVIHELMQRASHFALKEKVATAFWEDCLRKGRSRSSGKSLRSGPSRHGICHWFHPGDLGV